MDIFEKYVKGKLSHMAVRGRILTVESKGQNMCAPLCVCYSELFSSGRYWYWCVSQNKSENGLKTEDGKNLLCLSFYLVATPHTSKTMSH